MIFLIYPNNLSFYTYKLFFRILNVITLVAKYSIYQPLLRQNMKGDNPTFTMIQNTVTGTQKHPPNTTS